MTDKKKVARIEESKLSYPKQLELFEVHEVEYSNAIDIYDTIPKYHLGKNIRRKNGQYLDVLQRELKHNTIDEEGKKVQILYKVSIHPASLVDKKTGKTINYYPSQREEIIEDVLRKMVTSQRRGVLYEDSVAVRFTLYELEQELKRVGHGYSRSEIKEAIEVCSSSVIKIKPQKAGNVKGIELSSPIFPLVYLKPDERLDGDSKALVTFHPLVTDSIKKGAYRMINYEKLIGFKTYLARWLYRRILIKFKQATVELPFKISLSTLVENSVISQYERISNMVRQVTKSLKEMKDSGVLDSFNIEPKKNKRKWIDAVFELHLSRSFVKDIIKANSENKKKRESISGPEKKALGLPLDDLKAELMREVYGLSRVDIEQILSNVKDVEKKKIYMEALAAAEVSIKSKRGECIPAAITKDALKKEYQRPKKVNNDLLSGIDRVKLPENWAPPESTVDDPNFLSALKEALENNLSEKEFEWFKDLGLYSLNEKEIIFTTTKFNRDWIIKNYLKTESVFKSTIFNLRKGLEKIEVMAMGKQNT